MRCSRTFHKYERSCIHISWIKYFIKLPLPLEPNCDCKHKRQHISIQHRRHVSVTISIASTLSSHEPLPNTIFPRMCCKFKFLENGVSREAPWNETVSIIANLSTVISLATRDGDIVHSSVLRNGDMFPLKLEQGAVLLLLRRRYRIRNEMQATSFHARMVASFHDRISRPQGKAEAPMCWKAIWKTGKNNSFSISVYVRIGEFNVARDCRFFTMFRHAYRSYGLFQNTWH